jgi:hypothetical protein
MKVRLSTDEAGIRSTHGLTGRWNDRNWNGFGAGTLKALTAAAGIGENGGYAVTIELAVGSMPANGPTADFEAVLGTAAVSVA